MLWSSVVIGISTVLHFLISFIKTAMGNLWAVYRRALLRALYVSTIQCYIIYEVACLISQYSPLNLLDEEIGRIHERKINLPLVKLISLLKMNTTRDSVYLAECIGFERKRSMAKPQMSIWWSKLLCHRVPYVTWVILQIFI